MVHWMAVDVIFSLRSCFRCQGSGFRVSLFRVKLLGFTIPSVGNLWQPERDVSK